jgi:hypothetical protein
MSKAHIIVGATGTGKSTFLKSILNKVKNKNSLFIYDINNEYKDYFPYDFIDFEDFVIAASNVENSIQIYEEATIFLNNRSCNRYIIDILTRKRHTNNFVFLVFHSMRSVPRYIYELSNYITIFKTNDSPGMTSRELKDERLESIMLHVKNNKNSHYCETLKIY